MKFHSLGEADRYDELLTWLAAGHISDLSTQIPFVIWKGERTKKVVKYVADYRYFEGALEIVEDFKGKITQEFKLKAKLFKESFPNIELRISKRAPHGRSGQSFVLSRL